MSSPASASAVAAAGSGAASPPWYGQTIDAVASALTTNAQHGLAAADATARLAANGPNALPPARRRGAGRIAAAQFTDPMVLLLLAAAIVSGIVGEVSDAIAICAIVILNAVMGFVQEYRAERAVAALAAMAAPMAQVRRDGRVISLAATDLVTGDVVVLTAGAFVPADLRITTVVQLRIDESALTGESAPVDKIIAPLTGDALPIGDRRNLAFRGTVVINGRGEGLVVATGHATEIGRIAALLNTETEPKTPMQQRLGVFARRLAIIVVVICIVAAGFGLLRGEDPVRVLLTAISLAVAAVPEALPAVLTVALALGARTMATQHALVRRLSAVETLGSVTVICTDKTGTLTENAMQVTQLRTPESPDGANTADAAWRSAHQPLLLAMALSNDAERAPDGALAGDPTETALVVFAADAGCDKDAQLVSHARVGEEPFTSERAMMTTVHRSDTSWITFTKGSPEQVIACCTAVEGGGWDPLLLSATMAGEGLRVLAIASKTLASQDAVANVATLEHDLTLLGLVGLLDPPRPDAAAAIAQCQAAGIRVVMITGDHPSTAAAIAHSLKILPEGDAGMLTGAALDALPDATRGDVVESMRVFARAAPEQKIRIVESLQAHGHYVAMTGDGVNDAPALRRANIGVAMGLGGTDVAREAAHLVLLDDNFSTIVSAVREGRRVYDNLRRFIRYTLSCNSGEVLTVFLAPLIGLPVPFLPIHILWINLVTDGLPSLALAAEPAERGVMQRPPRPPAESIFAHGLWQHVVWVGILLATVTLSVQGWAYTTGDAHWQSMTFTVLALSQMGHVMAVRSERESLFTMGLWTNRPLLGAVTLSIALQVSTLYVPVLQRVFRTAPLSLWELAACFACSGLLLGAVEIEKFLIRRGVLYAAPKPVAAGARLDA